MDGAVYEGEWVNNKAEGKETFWHAEGDVSIGEFKADQANGHREYTHINGSRYEGKWVNDVQILQLWGLIEINIIIAKLFLNKLL